MAVLQVRDIDDGLYENLKAIAKNDHRSISQEVVAILEEHLKSPQKGRRISQTDEFLALSWSGSETAEAIVKTARSQRRQSERFGAKKNDLFD